MVKRKSVFVKRGTDLKQVAADPVDIAPTEPVVLNTQVVGNIGLYYVCLRLSTLGWNVMPTARNARGVDVIAYNQDASRTVAIQVKALSKRYAVPLGSSLDKLMGDYLIVCRDVVTTPIAFVLTPEEARAKAVKAGKLGKHSYWFEPKDYEHPTFREAWSRLGSAR